MSLRKKAVSGVAWASLNQFGQIALQFVVGIILARLLSPADYGLFALVGVFLIFFQITIEGGLALAIVQRKNLSDDDVCTVFWFNLLASLVAYALIWLSAPLLSSFYSEPSLISLVRTLGVTVIIGSLSICPKAQLERQMSFRKLAIIQLPAFMLSAVVAIIMALDGHGTWSLAGMSLTNSCASLSMTWWISGWRPRFHFNAKSFRNLFGFGVNTAFESLNNAFFQNLLTLIIGRVYSPLEVGFYNRAKHYSDLPASSIFSVLTRVMLPLLSTVQDQPEKVKRIFTQSIRCSTMLSFPIFLGLVALAEPLVVLMIGEKWRSCVPYMQILCISSTILPLHAINVNAILSQGKSGLSLKLNFIKQFNQVVMIALTLPHGIEAMLWGQVTISALAFFINAWPNRKLMRVRLRDQLTIISPYALLSTLMAGVVMAALPHFGPILWIQLFAGSTLGIIIYLLGLKLMHLHAHQEIADIAQNIPFAGKLLRFVIG